LLNFKAEAENISSDMVTAELIRVVERPNPIV